MNRGSAASYWHRERERLARQKDYRLEKRADRIARAERVIINFKEQTRDHPHWREAKIVFLPDMGKYRLSLYGTNKIVTEEYLTKTAQVAEAWVHEQSLMQDIPESDK